MDLYRDDLGYLNILPIINPLDVYKRKFSFYLNGKEYFYKEITNIRNIYNELIAEEIASDLNIPHAHYDLASVGGNLGVISESFLEPGETITYMEDILPLVRGYTNIVDEKNNLDDIWDALELKYHDSIEVYEMMIDVINIFLFDALVANPDRHCCNIGIINSKNNTRITPSFDNSEMICEPSIILGMYSLAPRREDYKNPNRNMLEIMLNTGSKIYLEQLEGWLPVIEEDNLLKILERVSKRINAPLNEDIVYHILDEFNLNRKMLRDVISRVKENKKIKVLK